MFTIIGSLPFDGFGIGGSFGKDEMAKTLKWVIPHLPENKPRHLLGIGRIEDVFRAVENGVDLFDCVIPTREGRHGRIWTRVGHYDIRKGIYTSSKKRLEAGCKCPTCKKISQGELRRIFKDEKDEVKTQAQRYATMHNIWFFNNLLEDIRKSIKRAKFSEFKKKILKKE
jgi:queuine tRNA-ribosyltransferase